MSAHLSDQTMVDVLEGGGSPAQWAHVASCAACRSRLDEARAGGELVSRAEIPEPPGLYWEALRRSVSRRVAEEPVRRSRWGWVLPLAAASAAVVIIVLSFGGGPGTPEPNVLLPAWSALPPVAEDDDLAVVRGLDEAELAAWDEGRGLDVFVAGLSDAESEALVAALRVEPEGGQ
ncbi:MAG: hypothetical protein LJF30_04445 [Acidobacteria bacterium]|jgi:hypothetical protein|nr:hypothetical protein [Acidobacteriota bacterium]